MTSAYHRYLMWDFYAATEAWERAAEAATLGYRTELAEYERDHPRPTLREFMTGGSRAA